MKTARLILFCLLVMGLGLASAQDYQALYQYDYVPDSTAIESKRSVRVILNVNDINSWFASEGDFKRDSVYQLVRNGQLSVYEAISELKRFSRMGLSSFIISKNYETNETMIHDKIATQRYKYTDNASFDWKIGTETKTISGYNCQIATLNFGGRSYVAWFTFQIPIQDGPFLFQGLPGLIVSIQDTKNHHKFELLAFGTYKLHSHNERYNNELYVKTTKAEFLQTKKRYFENPDAFMESTGVTVVSKNAPKLNPWRGVIKNSIILNEY